MANSVAPMNAHIQLVSTLQHPRIDTECKQTILFMEVKKLACEGLVPSEFGCGAFRITAFPCTWHWNVSEYTSQNNAQHHMRGWGGVMCSPLCKGRGQSGICCMCSAPLRGVLYVHKPCGCIRRCASSQHINVMETPQLTGAQECLQQREHR